MIDDGTRGAVLRVPSSILTRVKQMMTRVGQRLWAGRSRPVAHGSLPFSAPPPVTLPWSDLDPGLFRQTTPTTCGSMSLLAADRLLHGERSTASEESVARWTRGGRRDGVGWVWPWPRFFGTSPWAAAAAMTRITGRRYRVMRLDPSSRHNRQDALSLARKAVGQGLPVPAFVGNDALPRHVVLIIGIDDAGLQILEPGAGEIVTVPADDWVNGDLALGGWRRLWAVILPAI